jgi:hypothetical protein
MQDLIGITVVILAFATAILVVFAVGCICLKVMFKIADKIF